jgi:tRNA dimethylallyltransferase
MTFPLKPIIATIVEKISANTLICICGPTAAGKTAMAIKLAEEFKSEIISFDSRQFYHEMSIGTAVPSPDELLAAPHHFIHDRSLKNALNAGSYEKEALDKLALLFKNNPIVIAVGGTGLYLKALLEGMDDLPAIPSEIREEITSQYQKEGLPFLQEELANLDADYWQKVDQKNPQRLIRAIELIRFSGKKMEALLQRPKKVRPFNVLKIGLSLDRELLYKRINLRVDLMFKAGLVNEVLPLMPFRDENALQTVGYKELFQYFEGEISLEEAQEEIKKNSRRYAKRQLTWFRRDSEISWFEPNQNIEVLELIKSRIDA